MSPTGSATVSSGPFSNSSLSSSARVIETFPSIQGEGIYVGRPHLFVRFWNCNMACHYCDTDYRGPYREMTREELSHEVADQLSKNGPFHAVSLTGGEPLLWSRFLKEWLPDLKRMGQTTYLETNGTLPDALSEVLPWIDIVAMDLKPPTATADRPFWKEHAEFLRRSTAAGRDVFVKIVVTERTADEEVETACELVASVDRKIPVVLQPVTPWREVRERPGWDQLSSWSHRAAEKLEQVRTLPQVHRLLGVP